MCSENKGADRLPSYCKADLRLCFRIMLNVGFLMTGLKYRSDISVMSCAQ